MRTTYDFAPLWRSTIGFDRLFDLVDADNMPVRRKTIRRATSSAWAKTATRSRWRSLVSHRTKSR